MAKVKLAIETQLKKLCYFYLGQHVNIQNLYTDKTKQLFDITILQQLEQFLHTGFQNRLEILLNTEIDTVTVNQMRKIINAQFEELQNKITQIILGKEVQELLNNKELELGDLGDLNRAQY
ncbi:hypothetical protein G9A89_023986 [Geosiphon pyriformis]|nr:hypothetical protein G9A89_023986 [Geosiphon pyriformis]